MIRPASPSDATAVVPLIIQAMGKLAQKLTNVEDKNVIHQILKHFFMQRGNQYSYENTLVFEEEGKVLGSLNAYDGGKLHELRKPFLHYVAEHHIQASLIKALKPKPGSFTLTVSALTLLPREKELENNSLKRV